MEKIDFKETTKNILETKGTNKAKFEQYKQDVFKKIKTDDKVFSILKKKGFDDNLIFENLGKCNDFYENYHAIKNVKTYSDCVEKGIYFQYDIVLENGFAEIKKIALPPYRTRLSLLSCFNRYRDFDDELLDATWQATKKALGSKINQINEARKKDKFIYFYGASRTGKTYAVVSYLNSYIPAVDYNIKVNFVDCAQRFEEISQLIFSKFNADKEEFNEILNDLKNDDVLVFDNFGSEYKCAQLRQSFLLPILRHRSKEKKLTIFTSIYTPMEIKDLYIFKKSDEILIKELMQIFDKSSTEVIATSKEPNLY